MKLSAASNLRDDGAMLKRGILNPKYIAAHIETFFQSL